MSEIKGQLLGIILVLVVFGAIAATLTGVFTTLSNSVETEVGKVSNEALSLSFEDLVD